MSLRKAINDKCRECIYDPGAPGNWRPQVTACTSPKCPIFPCRPQSKSPLQERSISGNSGGKLVPELKTRGGG